MSTFMPERDDYAEAVRDLADRTPLARKMRLELESIEPGFVSARLPLKADVTQQHGYAHAGTLATLADIVCGLAAYSLMIKGSSVMSVNINLSLMRPGEGDYLLGRGRVVKAGKKLFFTEADLLAVDVTGERLVAKATATMTRVTGS
jgi:uncharacterized protein (TIGR00369 family)